MIEAIIILGLLLLSSIVWISILKMDNNTKSNIIEKQDRIINHYKTTRNKTAKEILVLPENKIRKETKEDFILIYKDFTAWRFDIDNANDKWLKDKTFKIVKNQQANEEFKKDIFDIKPKDIDNDEANKLIEEYIKTRPRIKHNPPEPGRHF